MSLKIGTNIDYKAKRFLDERINLPKTLQDLKNWNIPVPEGFEVFVEGRWYVYRISFESEETGHWRKRIDNEYSGSELEDRDLEQDINIQLLMNTLFPLKFDYLSGGGTFEVGKQVQVTIIWRVKRNEKNPENNAETIEVIQRATKNTINDSENNITESEPTPGKWTYTYSLPEKITTNQSYALKVKASGITLTSTISYSFSYKRYWGVTENSSRSYFDNKKISEILTVTESDFNATWIKAVSSFNCAGGKYPFYIVPSNVSVGTIWINGIQNTDEITYRNVMIENASGATREYTVVILTANKQTGNLSIEFKS